MVQGEEVLVRNSYRVESEEKDKRQSFENLVCTLSLLKVQSVSS